MQRLNRCAPRPALGLLLGLLVLTLSSIASAGGASGGKEKGKDPATIFSEVPADLPLKKREAMSFLKGLDVQVGLRLKTGEPLAQEIFRKVPAGLVVYALEDFQKKKAGHSGRLPEGVEVEFPKKGEPLLILGHHKVLAVDGSVYKLYGNYASLLTLEKPEVPVFLNASRNTRLKYHRKHTYQEERYIPLPEGSSASDFKPYKKYRAVIDKYNKCEKKVWRKVENKVAGLRNTPDYRLTPKDRSTLMRLENKYSKKEKKKCKPERRQKARDNYFLALEKRNTSVRDAALAEIVAHLQSLP